jgi:hypothetical protein
MENSIPSILSSFGIIFTKSPGRIRFQYGGMEYYFSFDSGGAAFLYKIETIEESRSTFHELLMSDAMTINDIKSSIIGIINLKKPMRPYLYLL